MRFHTFAIEPIYQSLLKKSVERWAFLLYVLPNLVMTRKVTCLLLFLCLFLLETNAQPPGFPRISATTTPQRNGIQNVRVTRFENVSRNDSSLFRRDYIRLWVESLDSLKKNIPAKSKIILYIDNIPFDDLEPEFENDSTVVFKFQKNSVTDKPESNAWAYFYKKPREWILKGKSISLGYKDGQAVPSTATVDIVIIQGTWYVVGIILILCLVIILILLSLRSGLLRDGGSLASERRPYSLARTQFTLWLLLIASAYIFLWVSTGEMPVLTASSLILLGISGGTSVVAKMIDNSQALQLSPEAKTKGFMTDILSDENGVSIHRLQMFVFTLVIGLIFCHDVLVIFEMPDFDSNLLMLMGISSGTYAGFKVTENNSSTPVG
jgi:hypothetical protein